MAQGQPNLSGVVAGLAGLGATGLLLGAFADPETRFGWQAAAAGTSGLCLAALVWLLAPTPPPVPSEEDRYAVLLERHVCPQCLHPNRPWRSICRRCMTPSGGLAALLPFESNLLYGWAMGAAFRLRRPTGLQCLGGMAVSAPELASFGFLCLGWEVWDPTGFYWSWELSFGALLFVQYGLWAAFQCIAFVRLPLRWASSRAEVPEP